MIQQQVVFVFTIVFVFTTNANSLVDGNKALFELPIVHYNDFHARFEQTSWTSGQCQTSTEDTCVGGFARLYTAVMDTMKDRDNAILLNAGDNYQGTLWYTLHKWNITVEFMNKLPHDGMGLGNHEFDDKIAGVIPYLKTLECPVLAANIDASLEPNFTDYKEYVVVQRGGRDIGIVGYMLSTTNEISSTENLKFTDEIEAVNRVAKKLKDDGVNIIVALSHSGIDIDINVAENCPDVDVIVGGHSHTLMYTGTPPGGDLAYYEYPHVVTQASGHKVLVVQAGAYSKYLGNLTVHFDDQGEAVEWEGNPILLDKSIEQDPVILEELQPWKDAVDAMGSKVIGSTLVHLDATNGACTKGECNIGSFITDGMVYEHIKKGAPGSWTAVAIGVTNSGGIRTSIDEEANTGIITFGDLALVQPFQNTFDVIELQGKYILEALEFAVARQYGKHLDPNREFNGQGFLQWSGIHVTYDMNQPIGKRVVSLAVLCSLCRVPKYEDLDLEKWYPLVMNSFLVDGGDGYFVIRDNFRNRITGRLDTEVLTDYIEAKSPIIQGLDGRIVIIQLDPDMSTTTPSVPGGSSTIAVQTCLVLISVLLTTLSLT